MTVHVSPAGGNAWKFYSGLGRENEMQLPQPVKKKSGLVHFLVLLGF